MDDILFTRDNFLGFHPASRISTPRKKIPKIPCGPIDKRGPIDDAIDSEIGSPKHAKLEE